MLHTENVNLRLTKDEKALIIRCSKKASAPTSTFIRMIVLRECEKLENGTGKKDTE